MAAVPDILTDDSPRPQVSAACASGGKALYAGSMNKVAAIALRRRRSTEPARG